MVFAIPPNDKPLSPFQLSSPTILNSHNLCLDGLSESSHGRSDSGGRRSTEDVSATSVLLVASLGLAQPDTDSSSLDRGLTTGRAGVLGVLGDFHLLDAVEANRGIDGASQRQVVEQGRRRAGYRISKGLRGESVSFSYRSYKVRIRESILLRTSFSARHHIGHRTFR